jgi:hypothetical protein
VRKESVVVTYYVTVTSHTPIHQEKEKELISCLGISIEIPFMGVLRRNTIFAYFEQVYNIINKVLHDTTYTVIPTMKVVT